MKIKKDIVHRRNWISVALQKRKKYRVFFSRSALGDEVDTGVRSKKILIWEKTLSFFTFRRATENRRLLSTISLWIFTIFSSAFYKSSSIHLANKLCKRHFDSACACAITHFLVKVLEALKKPLYLHDYTCYPQTNEQR